MRSIDLGAMEVVSTYEELQDFNKVGSPFSIPKAALVLAGFHPDFSMERFASLGRPLYVGLSRKSMFREILGLELEQRAEATRLAVALLAARRIPYHRVHDVAGCAQALRLVEAMTPLA